MCLAPVASRLARPAFEQATPLSGPGAGAAGSHGQARNRQPPRFLPPAAAAAAPLGVPRSIGARCRHQRRLDMSCPAAATRASSSSSGETRHGTGACAFRQWRTRPTATSQQAHRRRMRCSGRSRRGHPAAVATRAARGGGAVGRPVQRRRQARPVEARTASGRRGARISRRPRARHGAAVMKRGSGGGQRGRNGGDDDVAKAVVCSEMWGGSCGPRAEARTGVREPKHDVHVATVNHDVITASSPIGCLSCHVIRREQSRVSNAPLHVYRVNFRYSELQMWRPFRAHIGGILIQDTHCKDTHKVQYECSSSRRQCSQRLLPSSILSKTSLLQGSICSATHAGAKAIREFGLGGQQRVYRDGCPGMGHDNAIVVVERKTGVGRRTANSYRPGGGSVHGVSRHGVEGGGRKVWKAAKWKCPVRRHAAAVNVIS